MTWLVNSLEISRQSFVALLRNRLTWLVGLLVFGMGVLGMVMPGRASAQNYGPDLFGIIATMFYLQMVLPFSAMFFGVQAVHGDIEDRTIHYRFLRPVHRSSILVGKWLAVAALSAGLGLLAVAALHVGMSSLGREWKGGVPPDAAELWWYGQAVLIAAAAYSAVAVLFGAFFKRPMIWSAIFIVGWELMASNFPPEAGVRTLTVADPVRRFLLAGLELEPNSPLAQVLWPDYTTWSPEDMGNPVRTVVLFAVICLGLGLWVYGRTEYDSRPRE